VARRNSKKSPAPDTRVAIIEAAVRILGRSGPAGLSASALTREVGIGKATLFHHFRSVDEIPLVALEHLALELKAFTPSAKAQKGNAIEALGEGTRQLIAQHRDFINAYFVFFAKALFDPALRKRLAECGAEPRAMIGEMVDAANARDKEDVVTLIAIMLDGLALHLLLADDQRPIMRAWSMFAKSVAARQRKPRRAPASPRRSKRRGRKKPAR
jgi:TetR/AcrR family transcriptional regulator, regulator of biofilm formation and stress response